MSRQPLLHPISNLEYHSFVHFLNQLIDRRGLTHNQMRSVGFLREARNDSVVNNRHNSLDSNQLSLVPAYAEMEAQVSQLCQAVERMQASVNSQNRSGGVKSSVTFPAFRGDESEDAHEFVRNYKRAGRLNGWDSNSLALGLPLYLKGYGSAWFRTLPRADEMSFEELSEKLITHFASGASEWRVFVQGLIPEIRDKAKSADISVDERINLAQHVIVEGSNRTSPEDSSSRPPQSSRQEQGACLESSIVIILSIILAVVIKVLELFEVVITSTVEVLKRPPVSSKGHATLFSGASTPKFSALSIQDKTPECLCEVSKGEPQSSRAVVEENSQAFEQADEIYDDIIISEVIPHSVKITDSNKTLCSDYSPLTNSNIKNSDQGSTSLSVSRTLNNPSSRARAEKEYSGAAITAVSASVWRKHLCYAYPKLSVPASENVTTVNGSLLTTIGKTSMEFVIDSRIFNFEVCVIEDLSFDIILGRDFLQRFCFKVDFENGLVSFPSEPSPFPFEGLRVDDDDDLIDKAFISSVHASRTFVIPPQSEILISGELEDSSNKYGIGGMIVPKPDLSHRDSIFRASEIVSVAEDGTVPVRLVNPSFEPVKIYRRTRRANFEEVDRNKATSELNASEKLRESHCSLNSDNQPKECDYSQLPDLSDSILSADDKIKFRDLFKKYRDVFAFSDAELGRTLLVQRVIDTDDATPIKQMPYRTSPEEECAVAFDKLKRVFVSAPVLAYPNFKEPFLQFVDASSTGIRFTLAQVQNGKEVAIAYNGRGLNSAERNYSTTEREALALIEGIKKFQPYPQNRQFTVVTDHSSLRWLMNVKDAFGRLARWALLLEQYDFEIIIALGLSHLLTKEIGPYRIVEQSSPVHFRLRTDTNKKVTFAVHANRLKPFIDPSLRPIEPPLVDDPSEPYLDESDTPDDNFESELPVDKKVNSRPPVSDTTDSSSQSDNQVRPCSDSSEKDDDRIFQADRILKSRKKKGKIEYLVKWHNLPRSQSTWEPEQNILDKRLIDNFNNSRK
ncbi:Retrovirus-related Pol polyprotein [Stylophora pistillata]|uniref:Retrovirus-related Pol polyprotein n=1 Tax=Stylophora pistillata TaxID=50429 RepID=A0A2B4RJL5_STYPI|nr:Retrovirus-related Pol polyprotein [Stylophora pistillata]